MSETSIPAEKSVSLRVLERAQDIAADIWDHCANPEHVIYNPFLSHAFFVAVEESGSACTETGWTPHHLCLEDENANIVGILPLYLKSHSQGEYIFDHNWADAFYRAGGNYFPKLLSAVPFSPVTGRRFLTSAAQPEIAKQQMRWLAQGANQLLEKYSLSSLHINFLPEDQWRDLGADGFLQRMDQQFHWHNDGFETFGEFLDTLSSRKRKNLRKEREKALDNGIEIEWATGDNLQAHHWDGFYEFYLDTGNRKWGTPYLTRDFFRHLHDSLADHTLLILAKRDGRYIAGALNLIGGDTLYGRNWGCLEDHPCLHFEVCYYQAIDFAIAHGLKHVEAGAQGAHKIARGYVPQPTYSAHQILHPGLREAIKTYLESERQYVENDIEILNNMTPFKNNPSDA
jgi:predicted N-acyltransferase